MAEEKIRVLVSKDPCENCKLKPCARKCIFAQMYENGPAIAKSDVIDKLAKAICANEDKYVDCKQCEFNGAEDCKRYYRNNWLYTAKAVFNALLESK